MKACLYSAQKLPELRRKRAPVDLPKRPVREIIELAAEVFGVPATGIIGLSRKQHIVRARQAVCRVAYEQGWGTPAIGSRLCSRDHSTILHARDQVDIHYTRDPSFASKYRLLCERALPETQCGSPGK